MRYKIARPTSVLTTERNPRVAMAQRAARVRAQVEPQIPQWKALVANRQSRFGPLQWPGTARDVAWSSAPVFARAPAGWYRRGFYA